MSSPGVATYRPRTQHRLLLVALALIACSPAATPYSIERASAERSYAHGRYRQAAAHWQRVAALAPGTRKRSEAIYREAMSWLRAGDWQRADRVLKQLVQTAPRSGQAPRAAYDRAVIALKHGSRDHGLELLQQVALSYPSSGPARSAVRRHLREIRIEQGFEKEAAQIQRFRKELAGTPLEEDLSYAHADNLLRRGRHKAALASFLDVAKRYPYPSGAYWDDSLLQAAELELKLSRPRAAIGHLRRLLKEREPSSMVGSYERHYADAQFRIAEIYRDELASPTRARQEFHRVHTVYKTSRLRDDAMWEEAKLAVAAKQTKAACETLESLVDEQEDSRFVACAPLLCRELRVKTERPCPNYISGQLP